MARSRFFPVVITGLILALLVGGGAVAAKMITGKQIKNGSVSTKDVKNNNLKSKDLKNGGVSSKDIKNQTVDTDDLANDSVTEGKIAPGAIAFPELAVEHPVPNQRVMPRATCRSARGGPLRRRKPEAVRVDADRQAAFGNSFEFAGVRLEDHGRAVLDVQRRRTAWCGHRCGSRSTLTSWRMTRWGPCGVHHARPRDRGGLDGVADPGDALADDAWYLTGDEGTTTGCNEVT